MKMHIYGDYGDDSPTVLLVHPMLSSASRMKTRSPATWAQGCVSSPGPVRPRGRDLPAPTCRRPGGGDPEWLTSHEVRCLSGIRGRRSAGRVLRATALPRSVV